MNGNYLLDVGPTDQALMPQGGADVLRHIRGLAQGQRRIALRHAGQPSGQAGLGLLDAEENAARNDALPARLQLAGRWEADGPRGEPAGGVRRAAAGRRQAAPVTPGEGSVTLQVPAVSLDPISTTVVLELQGTGPKP